MMYSLKWPLKKKTNIGFQDQLSLNAGQKYCRMLQKEHSAILSTFIKLPFVIKIFVLLILEWPLKTGFTVYEFPDQNLDLVPLDMSALAFNSFINSGDFFTC